MAVALPQLPNDLRDLKYYYDAIQRRIPAAWNNRLGILSQVVAHAADVVTWTFNRNAADDLWQIWQVCHDRLLLGLPAAYPNRNLSNDCVQMGQYLQAFKPVAELLIDHGLHDVKDELVHQWYVQAGQNVPGLERASHTGHDDETFLVFSARVRAAIGDYLHPTPPQWIAAAGYNFAVDPYIRALGLLGGLAVHWTVYRANLGALGGLTCASPLATIYDALIPRGAGPVGVHVTLEVHGQNHVNNPRVLGRPARILVHQVINPGQLPGGVSIANMAGVLNAENARLQTVLQNWVAGRNNRVRPGWATH